MPLVSLRPNSIAALLESPLAIVIPVYNESATIESVIASWMHELDKQGVDYQFILLNDGSSDSTLEVLQRLAATHPKRIIVVDKTNSGHGRTCRLGYDAAVASPHVEWILQIDSDGQCDPSYLSEFWRGRDQADCVFGRRFVRDDGFARAMTSRICKLGATLLGGKDMVDPNVPYRLLRRETLAAALQVIPASFDIHNVALTFVLKRNPDLRWQYIPIRFLSRQGGSNSINLLNVAHLGVSMLFDLAKLRGRVQ
jgi:glycosyltransferase involved in cell wall biosynthesis